MAYKPPANLSNTFLDRPAPNWKELTLKVTNAVKAVDAAAKKFPPAIPADESMAYVNIRPMPVFPKEEIVSAKTPVEVTAIRQKNAIHLNNWAAIHNPGSLPIDGAEGEWLRDQWHKEKKKKAAAATKVVPGGPAAGVNVMGVATKTLVENPNKAVERIRKENAAWLKSTEEAKEKAPILAAASLKDKDQKEGSAGCDKKLLEKVYKVLKDTKDVNYGLAHCAIACSNTPGHNGLEKDPLLKGLLGHMKKRPDPQKAYLEKLLKIPPAGTPAAAVANEAVAIADIRKRNEAWLKSVGMEGAKMKGGAKPEKRNDLLALAKKGYPEYEKPNALGVCGGQVKVAPTNSWGTPATAPATIKAQREASAQALWPAPAPALKKTQDAELARIHKECEAYEKGAETHVDGFVHAHESPHSAYPQAHSYEYGAVEQHNMYMHCSQAHVPIQPTHGGFSAGTAGVVYVPYY